MSPKSNHTVRRTRGKKKGQFAKTKVVQAREKLLKSVAANRQNKLLKKPKIMRCDEDHVEMNRHVDLVTLGKELWCTDCDLPISLKDVRHEKKYGVASILKVECMRCHIYHKVSTFQAEENSPISFPVNSNIALGMIDNGLGETHVNGLLASANFPAISPTFLKKTERRVGLVIEEVAKESCLESIRLEKEETLAARQKEDTMDVDSQVRSRESGIVNVIAGFDAGWQKRGTGHSYNSLSGHGTLIGHYSGKILSYAVRCTTCRKCGLGQSTETHNCRKNYEGSAKAVKPDMAVELIHKNVLLQQENVRISVLVGDDDSSTIAAVRRSASYEITKWSDYNHTHKSMTSALYTLKLSTKLIEYFSHCFSHAVKQNKGDAEKFAKALRSVVSHAFGDHTLCGDWCAAKNNPDGSYVHKNLPGGKPLQNTDLRVSLTKIFARYADNAEKIANCGSTQSNESVNHMIASKNPKSRHYSTSDSLNFRVAAAVCQKNIGCNYYSNVRQKLKMMPAPVSEKFWKRKDIKRKKQKILNKTIDQKKRRLQLKKQRKTKNSLNSRKEGVTYESGVALDDVSAVLPQRLPEIGNCVLESLNEFKVVVFDLETTGLSKNDEICQIAACTNENSFNAYIIPSKSISKKAYEITGLQLIDGDLYYEDKRVEAFPARVACTNFLTYLNSFKCPIILLAHNGFSFDMPRVINLFTDLGFMEEFKSVVIGCSDSLHLCKKILTDRKKEKKKVFSTSFNYGLTT